MKFCNLYTRHALTIQFLRHSENPRYGAFEAGFVIKSMNIL